LIAAPTWLEFLIIAPGLIGIVVIYTFFILAIVRIFKMFSVTEKVEKSELYIILHLCAGLTLPIDIIFCIITGKFNAN
jgi:hypothetical protein